jgi:hypothetical protein
MYSYQKERDRYDSPLEQNKDQNKGPHRSNPDKENQIKGKQG